MCPNAQPEPLLAQPEAIPSCPIIRYVEEEANFHLTTTHFQTTVESDISLEPYIPEDIAALQHHESTSLLNQ